MSSQSPGGEGNKGPTKSSSKQASTSSILKGISRDKLVDFVGQLKKLVKQLRSEKEALQEDVGRLHFVVTIGYQSL